MFVGSRCLKASCSWSLREEMAVDQTEKRTWDIRTASTAKYHFAIKPHCRRFRMCTFSSDASNTRHPGFQNLHKIMLFLATTTRQRMPFPKWFSLFPASTGKIFCVILLFFISLDTKSIKIRFSEENKEWTIANYLCRTIVTNWLFIACRSILYRF